MTLSRSTFLHSIVSGAAALAATSPAQAQNGDQSASGEVVRALVLSGGTAHGAYEAGVLHALASGSAFNQTQEPCNWCVPAQPVPVLPSETPFDFIVGTSIGALNGALLATGGESQLYRLWHSIGSQQVLVTRPEYENVVDPQTGLIDKVWALGTIGLRAVHSSVESICETAPVEKILRENLLDPGGELKPFTLPLLWTATDLTRPCAGFFYQLPRPDSGAGKWSDPSFISRLSNKLNAQTWGPTNATPYHVIDCLRASTAIPGVFEPVVITPSGQADRHVLSDGGVVNNTPFALAMLAGSFLMERPAKLEIYAVILREPPPSDCPSKKESDCPFADPKDTVGLLISVYNAMAQRLFEDAARRVVEVAKLRPIAGLFGAFIRAELSLREAISLAPSSVRLFAISPSYRLAGSSYAFYDQSSINYNFNAGLQDATNCGFREYLQQKEFCFLG